MASVYMDLSAANAIMKELYDDQTVQVEILKNNPFLAMIPKQTDFEGKSLPVPVAYGAGGGRSATFSQAQAGQAAPAIAEFMVKRVRDYSVFSIDRETALAAATQKGSFISAAKLSMDIAMQSLKNSMAHATFRTGTGTKGQISSISTGVITLSDASTAVFFEVNETLQANATDGGTPRAAAGYVVAVDRIGGTVTVSTSLGGAAASPSGWTSGDSLLTSGDNNAKMSGLLAWIPATAPTTGDNFFGVDRSVDVQRLSGIRLSYADRSIEEALVDAANTLGNFDSLPDTCIMNYASWSSLEKALGSRVQYVDLKSEAGIGFRGIVIQGPAGPISVFADRNCPPKSCFVLQLNTWELKSLGEAPHLQTDNVDGDMLRIYNADAAEGRISMYGNVICHKPSANAYVTLGA